MVILAVDDERLALEGLVSAIGKVCKGADVYAFMKTKEALEFLKEHKGPVLFITEKGNPAFCQLVDFIAEADSKILADAIEREWYEDYRLEELDMYNANAFFPKEVYVFDLTMKWCVAFTHETSDWESEIDNPMKAAESRVCLIWKD